jgi:DNA-binding Lrp family transcriptional regulator
LCYKDPKTKINMDELDRNLLVELQTDPRKSNSRLAKSLGITEPTVRRRIEHLVSSAELVFTALPDLKWFGYQTSAYLGIKVKEPSIIPVVAEQLCRFEHIRAVTICEGSIDILVGGDFRSNEELSNFITDQLMHINGIVQVDTMVELRSIKRRAFGRIDNRYMTQTKTNQTGRFTVDDIDRRLVLELQKNSRAPLKKIARTLGISNPTVHRHIKALVESGAVELTAITNIAKIQYPVNGFIGIEVENIKLDTVIEVISQHTQVQYAGIFSGPVQLLAAVYAPTPDDLSYLVYHVIAQTKGVRRIAWLIRVHTVKRNFSWIWV